MMLRHYSILAQNMGFSTSLTQSRWFSRRRQQNGNQLEVHMCSQKILLKTKALLI